MRGMAAILRLRRERERSRGGRRLWKIRRYYGNGDSAEAKGEWREVEEHVRETMTVLPEVTWKGEERGGERLEG